MDMRIIIKVRTELNNNLELLSDMKDIYITQQDRVEIAKSLFGILPQDADIEVAKEERIPK